MKTLNFEFPGTGNTLHTDKAVIAGVVGSGNLEVMIETVDLNGVCAVTVETSVTGFDETWERVLEEFFIRNPVRDIRVSINDAGATPAVVMLRLGQALAKLQGDENADD